MRESLRFRLGKKLKTTWGNVIMDIKLWKYAVWVSICEKIKNGN